MNHKIEFAELKDAAGGGEVDKSSAKLPCGVDASDSAGTVEDLESFLVDLTASQYDVHR